MTVRGPDVGGAASSEDRGQTKAELTRRRILDAAAKVFRARGFVGSRLSDIAAEAGLQAGSLYYHFESREALVEEVMWAGQLRTEEHVRAQLATLGPNASPISRLHTAIEAHLLAVLSSTDANSASIKMIGQVPPDIRERLLVGQRAYGDLWRGLLTDARDAGELRDDVDLSIVRMAIMGALNWSVEWYHAEKGHPERIAADIATVLLDGLRVDGAGGTDGHCGKPGNDGEHGNDGGYGNGGYTGNGGNGGRPAR